MVLKVSRAVREALCLVLLGVACAHASSTTAGTQKWSFTTGGEVASSPAISSDGSTVFVGSKDWKLYAIDAATGAEKWAFTTGNWVKSSPAISSDGSTVFVGSFDNKLYAIDAGFVFAETTSSTPMLTIVTSGPSNPSTHLDILASSLRPESCIYHP